MKRLLLCRHAKSSWKDMNLGDIDRPLNKRGKRDAPIMGTRLAEKGMKPDLIVSSPARRALKTARQMARQLDYPKKNILVESGLYGAYPEFLLEYVMGLDNGNRIVMLVGHNPETTEFANLLGGLDIFNVPTCGIVALDFDTDSWQDIGSKKGSLAFFDYPKKDMLKEE